MHQYNEPTRIPLYDYNGRGPKKTKEAIVTGGEKERKRAGQHGTVKACFITECMAGHHSYIVLYQASQGLCVKVPFSQLGNELSKFSIYYFEMIILRYKNYIVFLQCQDWIDNTRRIRNGPTGSLMLHRSEG